MVSATQFQSLPQTSTSSPPSPSPLCLRRRSYADSRPHTRTQTPKQMYICPRATACLRGLRATKWAHAANSALKDRAGQHRHTKTRAPVHSHGALKAHGSTLATEHTPANARRTARRGPQSGCRQSPGLWPAPAQLRSSAGTLASRKSHGGGRFCSKGAFPAHYLPDFCPSPPVPRLALPEPQQRLHPLVHYRRSRHPSCSLPRRGLGMLQHSTRLEPPSSWWALQVRRWRGGRRAGSWGRAWAAKGAET